MAYFKINEPNKTPKWIKSIDRANGTLEFSEDRNGCFQQDGGFFADSEFAYLKFHFTEEYPELEYMTIDTDCGYSSYAAYAGMGQGLQEAPNEQIADIPWGRDVEAVQENNAVIIPQEPLFVEVGNAAQNAELTPW